MPSVTSRVARSQPAAATTFPPAPPVTRATNQLATDAAAPARARTVARSDRPPNDRLSNGFLDRALADAARDTPRHAGFDEQRFTLAPECQLTRGERAAASTLFV
jgi:hypothetical protein